MKNRDNRPHHIEHDKLINTVDEECQHVACNHFAAACRIEHLAADHAEQNSNRNREDGGQDETGDAPNLPVGNQNQRNFACHGAEGHTEVQTHARHNRNQQAEDEERIAPETGGNLIEQIRRGEARNRDADRADENEHQRHGVVPKKTKEAVAANGLAGCGSIGFCAHFFLPPSVLRVSAYRIIPLETT